MVGGCTTDQVCPSSVDDGMPSRSSHGSCSVGEVADKSFAALELDGHDTLLHLNGVIVGNAPINACHRGEVVVGRQLGEQGLVPSQVRLLTGIHIGGGGSSMCSLIPGYDVVDVDHVAMQLGQLWVVPPPWSWKGGGETYSDVRATTRCRASISL